MLSDENDNTIHLLEKYAVLLTDITHSDLLQRDAADVAVDT